ncbi:LysR family transcriptional regulator [Planomonospora sp. ID91781]|uniref:LysR family transcriptional regulator n=1 Tax=Planomonospora sp. ID91781 TaxID=2738135 RepID=UPI0018C44477|nr:LysR family transcriptional regulator [Planomonospora sp. ID91781]MBG0820147.1 LysR family transcriptional regulator [Planomonospora sp. ID91781]
MEPGPPLRDVRCFVLVARHLGFSRAAAELRMSQPAVSQAVGRLERSLGVRLFDRNSREVGLSTVGKALLPYAEAMLESAAAFAEEAARLAAPGEPVVRLAYAPLAGTLAARTARRLARRRPPVGVELRQAGWRAATTALAAGEVTAAVIGAPFPRGLATAARFHVAVGHLAVPADDPLARLPEVRLDRLGRHRVILPRDRPPGGVWARLAALLPGPHRHHVVPGGIDDFAAALDLVAAGNGLLAAPDPLVRTVRRDDVRFVPLDGADLRMTYGLAWSPERVSPELMALVQAVQETLWTR